MEKLTERLIEILETIGIIGSLVFAVGFIVFLLGLGVTIGSVSAGSTASRPALLLFGGVIMVAGILQMVFRRHKRPNVLRVLKRPRVIHEVLNALESGNTDFLRKNLLSLELVNYVGEYIRDEPVEDGSLNLDSIRNLLEMAITESDEWFRCNVIELAGNLGILWRDNPRVKEDFPPLIKSILDRIPRSQFYAWELEQVKLALLLEEEERIDKVIKEVKAENKSFYLLGTIETPLLYLHNALRNPEGFHPIQPYVAVLLSLLVKDDDVLRLERDTALRFENRRVEPEKRLKDELEKIHI